MKVSLEFRLAFDTEQRLHPETRLQDWCKLCFQAVHGPGHAISDDEIARRWLWLEMDQDLSLTEPLWQPIGPGYGRLHMGPWKQAGIGAEVLLQAFLRSAREPQANQITCWQSWWADMAEWLTQEGYAAPDDETRPWVLPLPPETGQVHHSQAYHQLYRPHYRVLAVPVWQELKQNYKLGE